MQLSIFRLLAAFAMSGLLASSAVGADRVISPASGSWTIPKEYFGMHVRWGASTLYWPQARFHSWRIITGETTWYSIEPVKGQWQFAALDCAVARATDRQAEILYTLGYPAKWATDPNLIEMWNPGLALPPRDMADWETYVRQIATRYKGRIKYYELMNEPHFTEADGQYSKRDFPVATMVEMARIAHRVLREVDPEARLVSMSPSGAVDGIRRVDTFLKAGGGQYVDVLGFHFYTGGYKSELPEEIPGMVSKLRKILRDSGYPELEIWNTESGFYINGPGIPPGSVAATETLHTPVQGGAMVARSLILGAAAGLRRFYWYSWDIPSMALTEGKGRVITAAGHAYITTERWLRGATISECRSADDKLWICSLNRADRKAYLVWNTSGVRDWRPPALWQAKRYETLQGREAEADVSGRIQLDEAPVLIVADDKAWGTP